MDQIDRRIVRLLQGDGRMRIADLAEAVGLSATPCARRLDKLQADGVMLASPTEALARTATELNMTVVGI